MKAERSRNELRIGLGVAALLALALAVAASPAWAVWPGWTLFVLTAAVTAVTVYFSMPLPAGEGSLAHLVGLAAVLAFSPLSMIAAVAAGVAVGDVVRAAWRGGPSFRDVPPARRIGLLAFDVAQQVLSLLVAIGAYGIVGGEHPFGEFSTANSLALLAYIVGFYTAYNVLLLIDLWWRGETLRRYFTLNRNGLLALELLPVPYAILCALLNRLAGSWVYMSLASLNGVVAVVLHFLGVARINAEKRLLELTSLNQLSEAMRYGLDVDQLAEAIYQHVATLTGASNFQIALYDAETHALSFPIAIENGQRLKQERRRQANYLVDYVIRTAFPLTVPYDLPATLRRLGIEASQPPPTAWIGVPLIANERCIGCMAVHSNAEGEAMAADAGRLLSIIAGHAGVAIENATIYGQMRRRATELATLTEISAVMGASLDPQRVLGLVCSSVIQVFNAHKSAILLLSEDRQRLDLAHAKDVTEAYLAASKTVLIENTSRARAITTGQPVIVGDVQTADLPPEMVALARAEGFGAYAELPLLAQGQIIGILAVYFAGRHEFRSSEIELLRTFASQAALAVANARLYSRTDKALARRVEQLQALEAIGREMASTLDLDQRFDVVLDRAMEFTGAKAGSLWLYDFDEQRLHVVAVRGYSAQARLWLEQSASQRSITARVQRTGEVNLVPDVRMDADYADATGDTLSQLSVPIKHEGQTLGVITLESPVLNAFNREDADFAVQLAGQAAAAFENARLYQQLQNRLREQSLLYESSAALASILDLTTLLPTVAQKITQSVGATACVISDWNVEANTVVGIAAYNLEPGLKEYVGRPRPLDDYPATRRMLVNHDVLLARVDDAAADPAEANRLRTLRCGSLVALPLVSADRILGIVEILDQRPRDFTAAEVRLAETFAGQAAVAIQTARLFERVTEGRDQLLAVLNSTREGVLMIDAAGRVALVNPRIEQMWLVDRKELVGQHLTDLLNRGDVGIAEKLGFSPEALLELLTNLSQGLAVTAPKESYQVAGPTPRFFERSGTPVLDEKLRVIGWVIVLRDFTEEYELSQLREELVAMIVHDLRSPLTSVLGSLKLIEDLVVPTDQSGYLAEASDFALRASKKLLNLVDSLLDISKLEAGQMELELKPTALQLIASTVISDLTPVARQQGIALSNEVRPDLPPLMIDQEKVERVLTNLVDNALKFTPPEGQVAVRTEIVSGDVNATNGYRMVVCSVVDTGPGIPDEDRDRIFDRFAQVRGRRGRRRGTGLGLTFCKLVVEAHGGHIWVEDRPGGGSVFAFALPVAER